MQSGAIIAKTIDSRLDYETKDANARLIAAAPELLAALRDLLENAVAKERYIDTLTGEDVKNWELPDAALDSPEMAAARAAIAKAEGNA